MNLPYHALLPLRGLSVTLEFTAPAAPQALHQPALTAWLRHLAGELPDYENTLTLDALENGRVRYQRGDLYRFTLFSAAGGEGLLQALLERLQELPRGVKVTDAQAPFRDNLIFWAAHDLFTGAVVADVNELTCYGEDSLEAEASIWAGLNVCVLRWLSPARLLLPPEQRERLRGESRYCRHRGEFDFNLLRWRVHDGFAELLRRRGEQVPPRDLLPEPRGCKADVFWVDFAYRNAAGDAKPMGGLLGEVVFDCVGFDLDTWRLWVLGQYLGIGQRRVFGWGRYRLESLEGEYTLVRAAPCGFA